MTPAPATVALLARRGLKLGALGVTLYNDRRPDHLATPAVLDALRAVRPDAVRVHAGPQALLGCDPDHRDNRGVGPVLDALAAALPSARLELGVGVDGWTRAAAAGQLDAAAGMLLRVADLAAARGMLTVSWNGETAIEVAPIAGARLGSLTLRQVRAKHPQLVQLFSSFGGMSDVTHQLCYRAWRDADGTEPQWYLIDDELVRAHPDFEVGDGQLVQRLAAGRRSGDALARMGGLPATWNEVAVPYVQSYRARTAELARALRPEPAVQLWCMGPRGAADGTCYDLRAHAALVALRAERDAV